jgi:hypothetical protein
MCRSRLSRASAKSGRRQCLLCHRSSFEIFRIFDSTALPKSHFTRLSFITAGSWLSGTCSAITLHISAETNHAAQALRWDYFDSSFRE